MDPYEVLNIPRSADQTVIKLAFRKLAKEWHPDRNHQPGAKERFQAIQLAHDQLTGRAKYTPRTEHFTAQRTAYSPPRTTPAAEPNWADYFPTPNWDEFMRGTAQGSAYSQPHQRSPQEQREYDARVAKERRERNERIAKDRQERNERIAKSQRENAERLARNQALAEQQRRERDARYPRR
jgi:DnaJ-class molecular chaperone